MAEKSIELDSVEIAAAVFGNCDRNIRMLEKALPAPAARRAAHRASSGASGRTRRGVSATVPEEVALACGT